MFFFIFLLIRIKLSNRTKAICLFFPCLWIIHQGFQTLRNGYSNSQVLSALCNGSSYSCIAFNFSSWNVEITTFVALKPFAICSFTNRGLTMNFYNHSTRLGRRIFSNWNWISRDAYLAQIRTFSRTNKSYMTPIKIHIFNDGQTNA